ncbi:MAG: hypothetical protein N2511_01510 [Thermodesulfovibrionales bacterium]|nr:hypothetical protein [Thermodesulfovibrionales bacterium]
MSADLESLKLEIKRLKKILNELTPPLQVMIKRRGFRIYKKDPEDDLFIPQEKFIEDFYEMMKKYSFRLFLRDVIKNQPLFSLQQVTRYATKEVTAEYLSFLKEVELIKPEGSLYRVLRYPIRSFGETLEWFIAEILKREFVMETIRGVKLEKRLVGGDYDLISKFNGSILYMEIKSSPPKQIYNSEVAAFLDRVWDFMPELAIFFVDTELRMKDKIVPMFEEETRVKLGSDFICNRIEKEIFELNIDLKEQPKIFIINSKDSIINNIQTVFYSYFRTKGF